MRKVTKIVKWIAACCFILNNEALSAQAIIGTTGLLHAPNAEMQQEKTFIVGFNSVNTHSTSRHFWSYEVGHTYNYYLNVTFFPWLEVGYTCTLVHADHGSSYFPPRSWGKFTNQDRAFNARLRIWKEGNWKEWMPQLVLGFDDPGTHESYGGGDITTTAKHGNNYLTRYYLAASKHYSLLGYGEIGVHASWILGRSKSDPNYSKPAVGVNFRIGLPEGGDGLFNGDDFCWQQIVNGFNLMAEVCPGYASSSGRENINIGFDYHCWKDRIHVVADLENGKRFNMGLQFKIHLK